MAALAAVSAAVAVSCRHVERDADRKQQAETQPAQRQSQVGPATRPEAPCSPAGGGTSAQAARARLAGLAREATDLMVRTAQSRPASVGRVPTTRESRPEVQTRPHTQPASRPASGPAGRFSECLVAADRAMARGDFAAAVSLCRRAMDEGGEEARRSLDAHQCLAVALVASEQFDQAVQVYRRLIELGGEDRTTLFNLALAQTRLGRYSQAEETYRRLLARHDDFHQARYNLASLLQAQGKLTEARDTWQRVISDQPGLESARAALAEVLVDLGDLEGAMEQYAQAARLQPKLVSNWVNLAHCARSAGTLGRAAAAARRAAELSPRDASIHRLRGQIFLEMHRLSGRASLLNEALAAWEQSLRLDPAQDDLRELIRSYAASSRPAESR